MSLKSRASQSSVFISCRPCQLYLWWYDATAFVFFHYQNSPHCHQWSKAIATKCKILEFLFCSPFVLVFSLTIVQFVFFSSTTSFAASFSIVRMIYLVTIFIPSDEMYSFYKVFRDQKVIQPLMNCS
jgi:hypothetical protein